MNRCFIVFTKFFDDLNSKTKLRAQIDHKIVNDFNKACFLTIKNKFKNEDIFWSVNSLEKSIHSSYEKLKIIFQEGENLADFVIHSINQVKNDYDQIGILGSDCPQINLDQIKTSKADYKIGKCLDGGFYYFEFPNTLDLNVFRNVRYSTEFACDDLLHNIADEVNLLPIGFDVDTLEDFVKIKKHYLDGSLDDPEMVKFFEGQHG